MEINAFCDRFEWKRKPDAEGVKIPFRVMVHAQVLLYQASRIKAGHNAFFCNG